MEGSEFFLEDVQKQDFPEATHLDTALRDVIPKAMREYFQSTRRSQVFLDLPQGLPRKAVQEIKSIRGLGSSSVVSTDHARAWSEFYPLALAYSGKGAPPLKSWERLASQIVDAQKRGLRNFVPYSQWGPEEPVPNELIQLWETRHVLEMGVRLSARAGGKWKDPSWTEYSPEGAYISRKSKLFEHRSDLGHMILGKFIFVWISPGGENYALSRDMFLMFSDLISQRFLIQFSSIRARSQGDHNIPGLEDVSSILNWGDRVLRILGNEGYDVLKNWEALCTGVLIADGDEPVVEAEEFLTATVAGLMEIEEEHSVDLKLLEILKLLRDLLAQNPHFLSQVFGLYRLWGHPVVDLAGGIEKLKSVATGPKVTNFQYVKKIEHSFKEQFCINYWRKQGKWPNLDLSSLGDTSYLKEVIKENRPLVLSHRLYDQSDWEKVTGLKTFEVKDSYSMVDWLSDKAMSLSNDELRAAVETHGNIGEGWQRSVLYKWLTSDLESPAQLLDTIDQQGFPAEETVIGVYDKERELKIKARFFGLLTLWKRMYVVVTESMIANDILPFFPEVTMMDDYTTLQKKLYNLTSNVDKEAFWAVTYSVDFEKWNSQMRKEETLGIFKFLDNLYGYENVISRTHEMFEESTLYLANGLFLPEFRNQEMKESWASWNGHLGGIEGLRQKGWTLFSLMVLKHVAGEVGVRFRLIGQGDNQVFRVLYPKDQGIARARALHQEFTATLHRTLEQIGPPSKQSETWASSSLFSYGKFLIYKGAPLSVSWKRMCRFMRLSNDGFPSLSSSISSSSSNLTAAISSSLSVEHSYYMYLLEVMGSFWYNCRYPLSQDSILPTNQSWIVRGPPDLQKRRDSFKVNLTPDQRRQVISLSDSILGALCIFPLILGGYPIQLLGTCYMKGFPDPLTETIALLKGMYPHLPMFLRPYLINILYPIQSKYVNPTQIVQDPVSLNLITESNVGDRIKRFVSDYLSGATWITNQKVNLILDAAGERQDDLAALLYEMTPFNPRVGHDVISATLVGRALAIMGRLTKTRTLTQLALQDSSDNLSVKLQRAEESGMHAVIGQLMTKGDSYLRQKHIMTCSTVLADGLRRIGWKKHVSGVTTTSQWEAFSLSENPCKRCPDEEGYVLVRRCEGLPWVNVPFDRTGEVPPYMGSATKEKLGPQANRPEEEGGPLMKNIAKLLRIVRWGVEVMSNFHQLLKKILGTMSDHPSEWYETPEESVVGSLEHRWLDAVTKHKGSYAMLYTGPTLYHVSTNNLTTYARGGSNYTLHFQSVLLSVVAVLSARLAEGGFDEPVSWHLHLACEDCVREINEEFLEIPPKVESLIIPSLEDSDEYTRRTVPTGDTVSQSKLSVGTPTLPRIHWTLGCRLIKEALKMSTEVGDGRGISADVSVIPVLWGDRIRLLDLLPILASLLIIRVTCRLPPTAVVDIKTWKQEVLSRVLNFPSQAFSFFSPMLLPVWQRCLVAGPPLNLWTPASSPPSSGQVGACMAEGIVHTMDLLFSQEIPFPSDGMDVADAMTGVEALPVLRAGLAKVLSSQSDATLADFYALGAQVRSAEFPPQPGLRKTLPQLDMSLEGLRWSMFRHDHVVAEWDLAAEIKKLCPPDQAPFSTEPPSISLTAPPLSPVYSCNSQDLERVRVRLSMNVDAPFSPGPVSGSNHMFKALHFHTTAAYKLVQILSSVQISGPIKKAAAVADGSGTFGVVLAALYPESKVFVQSLVHLNQIPPHSLTEASPPAFDPYPSLRDRLIYVREAYEYPSDLTRVSTIKAISPLLKDTDLMTCDAEGGGWDSGTKGIQLALNLAGLQAKMLIMKSYASNWKMLLGQITILLQAYHKVSLFRSQWSGRFNTEVYLVCSGRYEAQGAPQLEDCILTSSHRIREQVEAAILKAVVGADWGRQLTESDKTIMQSAISQTSGQIWVKTRLKKYFLADAYMFPDDLVREEHREPWVKGKPTASRLRLRKNLWTQAVKKRCCQRFLIGLAASSWQATSGIVNLESWRERGVLQIWQTRTSWAWIVLLNKEASGDKLGDLIAEHELRLLYQLAGEASRAIKWRINPRWRPAKWDEPRWATQRPVSPRRTKRGGWEAQGESSSSFTD